MTLTEAARHYRDAAHNLEAFHRTNTARTAEMVERHRALSLDLANARAQLLKAAMEPDGPPHEMRLPGGDVAYQTIRAGEVVPGMWVMPLGAAVWRQVDEVGMTPDGVAQLVSDKYVYPCIADDKVKVASTVDGARLAAERQAQRAEAYDQACEAR